MIRNLMNLSAAQSVTKRRISTAKTIAGISVSHSTPKPSHPGQSNTSRSHESQSTQGTAAHTRAQTIRIKALCTVFVKLTNHEVEQRLKKEGIDFNIGALVPLRILQFGPLTLKELSEHIIVAPATLIPIIDELESKSLVTRAVNSTDRRKKQIKTTAKGSQLITKILAINSHSRLMDTVRKMDQRRADQLIETLEFLVTEVSGKKDLCATIAQNACRTMASPSAKQ